MNQGITVVSEAPALAPPPPPLAHHQPEAARLGLGPSEEETATLATFNRLVFRYLASHPDGTRLVELDQEFAARCIQARQTLRHLIDEGKAEKRGPRYFAI